MNLAVQWEPDSDRMMTLRTVTGLVKLPTIFVWAYNDTDWKSSLAEHTFPTVEEAQAATELLLGIVRA